MFTSQLVIEKGIIYPSSILLYLLGIDPNYIFALTKIKNKIY
ncbi:hypothetical protein DF16_orf03535 [Bacillus thuringiensis serovar kurstaki str. YBT-1520]|nr:hypothetical protein DF16_orf03535 [Bacillus thuringiensis serovar kurstaki str. YBT-1520]